MTETLAQEPGNAGAGLTAGAMLRQAREAKGLHIAALAVSLKVSVRKLEALEGDRFDELPDAVFVRGLACAVCRALRTDPQPVLERLPQRAQPVLIPASTQQAAFSTSPTGRLSGASGWFGNPALWAVVLLLGAAVVIGFLPEIKRWTQAVGWLDAVTPTSANPAIAPRPVAASAPAAMTLEAVSSMVVPPASVATTASAAVGAAAAASEPGPVVAPAQAVAVPASAASAAGTENLLRFTAHASTWIEVIDRYGAVAHKGTLAAGETLTVGGRVPLAVTVGRADGVRVQVRGQAFDLAAVSKANVARFEVK